MSEKEESETASGKDVRLVLKHSVLGWCAETTAHGFGRVVKPGSTTTVKVVWMLIVVLAMVGIGYHLYTVIALFLTYPTTEVTSISMIPTEFPYVTLCNQMGPSSLAVASQLSQSNSTLARYFDLLANYSDEFVQYEARTGTAVDDILQSPTGVYNNLNQSNVTAIGHSIDNFILYCTYAGRACNLNTDFQLFHDASFYNCYTFTGDEVIGSSDVGAGPSNGLSLIVYLESAFDDTQYDLSDDFKYNRYAEVENSMGVRLQLHHGNTLPSPIAAGFNIMPGYSTSIQLASTRVVKQPQPYSNCTYRKHLKHMGNYDYTSDRCLDVCLAEYVFKQCACASTAYPVTSTIAAQSDWRYCAKFDNTSGMTTQELFDNINCEADHSKRFSTSHKHDCSCYEQCEYTLYSETISAARWPAPLYIDDMFVSYVLEHDNYSSLHAYQQLHSVATDDNRTEQFQELVYSNFARINVFFKDTLVVNIDEYPTLDPFTLLATIGGTVGLWAGLSIITLIEVLLLLGDVLFVIIKHCRLRRFRKVEHNQ